MYQGNALDTLHRTHYSGDYSEKYSISSPILKVEGLVKIYGKRRVVDGVSFHVNKGEIVGLLGPNGAGKTTSFRMACGLINTNGGIVYLGSQDVTNWPMYRRSREGGMGYLPQDRSVFQKLSVQNNLYGIMEMLGIKRSVRKRRCDELLEKFQLTHLRYNYGSGLSGGERRRLEIARSLVSDPKIILLDEPFAAVDPITVTGIQEIIRQLSSEGISILITDHSVQDTLQITQRSYVIQSGRVLCHGTPEDVLNDPEARKVYFGENVNVNNIHSISLRHSSEQSQKQSQEQSHKQSHKQSHEQPHEQTSHSHRIFGHKKHTEKNKEPIIPPDPEWDEPPLTKPSHRITLPMSHAVSYSALDDDTADNTLDNTLEVQSSSPNSETHEVSQKPILRRVIQSGEKNIATAMPVNSNVSANRSVSEIPKPVLPTRPIGKRISSEQTRSEQTKSQQIKQERPKTEQPSGISGVFRSLGSLIRRK
ncbi:MAG: LPS export ABC transporter ATP-binding protein [Planctomycetaceae bacterium]|jgi:lipopolysaccharide export system ATP-binding protein|nr:LPS export ABC transporter ATP-binding protein [Planctomycetaceae bacterium]